MGCGLTIRSMRTPPRRPAVSPFDEDFDRREGTDAALKEPFPEAELDRRVSGGIASHWY